MKRQERSTEHKSVLFDSSVGLVDDNNMPLLMLFLLIFLQLVLRLSCELLLILEFKFELGGLLNTYRVDNLSGILKLFFRQYQMSKAKRRQHKQAALKILMNFGSHEDPPEKVEEFF